MSEFQVFPSFASYFAVLPYWLREKLMPAAIAYVVFAEDHMETNVAIAVHQSLKVLVMVAVGRRVAFGKLAEELGELQEVFT